MVSIAIFHKYQQTVSLAYNKRIGAQPISRTRYRRKLESTVIQDGGRANVRQWHSIERGGQRHFLRNVIDPLTFANIFLDLVRRTLLTGQGTRFAFKGRDTVSVGNYRKMEREGDSEREGYTVSLIKLPRKAIGSHRARLHNTPEALAISINAALFGITIMQRTTEPKEREFLLERERVGESTRDGNAH